VDSGEERKTFKRTPEESGIDPRLWDFADRLVAQSRVVVDRPRGSRHPRYPAYVYPLDYGYLDGTTAMDGGGIDVWQGSLSEKRVTGIILTIDLLKRDAELKFLVGCTAAKADTALSAHQAESQVALLIPRAAEEQQT